METKKSFKTRRGESILLDTSPDVCIFFGFKSGDNVFTPGAEKKLIVQGVGLSEVTKGFNRLWLSEEGDDLVRGWSPKLSDVNLRQQGFRLVGEVEEMQKKLSQDLGVFVTLRGGGFSFYVDASDQTCLAFGFKSGNEILSPDGRKFIVKGVAPIHVEKNSGQDVIWFIEEGDDHVSTWAKEPEKANLRNEGFRLVGEVEEMQKKLSQDSGVFVTRRGGGFSFYVDASEKICLAFGFKSGQECIDPNGDKVIIKGVAPINVEKNSGHDVLWYLQEKDDGVSIWGDDISKTNLCEQGFRLFGEVEAEQDELKKAGAEKVTSEDGHSFYVDASDEACLKFGHKKNDEVTHPCGATIRIVGVAPQNKGKFGKDVLWGMCSQKIGVACPFPQGEEAEKLSGISIMRGPGISIGIGGLGMLAALLGVEE